MRWPSGPGHGGASRPGSSRWSLTQNTVRWTDSSAAAISRETPSWQAIVSNLILAGGFAPADPPTASLAGAPAIPAPLRRLTRFARSVPLSSRGRVIMALTHVRITFLASAASRVRRAVDHDVDSPRAVLRP